MPEAKAPARINRLVSGKYYMTDDYSIFRELTGNRFVDRSRVQRIIKSIKEHGYITNPIIVNEKMEIIDGQGRFQALKELNMIVEYIISPGAGVAECIALNVYQKNWTALDYIKSYADQGMSDYKTLSRYLEKYESLPHGIVMAACKGKFTEVWSGEISGGNFVMRKDEDELEKELDFLLCINEIQFPILKAGGGKVRLLSAIRFCFSVPSVDKERLLNAIDKNAGKIYSSYSISDYIRLIEEFYNSRLGIANRLPLLFEYERRYAEVRSAKAKEAAKAKRTKQR